MLQLETLRLYGPVFYIPRYTAGSSINASTSEEKNISSHHIPMCSSTPPAYTRSPYIGALTLWSGDLVTGTMRRKSSFNLHLACIILGQRDRGSVQTNSQRWSLWLLYRDNSTRAGLDRRWKRAEKQEEAFKRGEGRSQGQYIRCYASYGAPGEG